MRRLFWLRHRGQLNQIRRISRRKPSRDWQWRVHPPLRLLTYRRQLARQAGALRLVLDDEPAVPGPPATVDVT